VVPSFADVKGAGQKEPTGRKAEEKELARSRVTTCVEKWAIGLHGIALS